MGERGRSYAWAPRFDKGDPEITELSDQAQFGWRCACELAQNAQTRSAEALNGEQITERLSLTRIGRDWAESADLIRARLRAARVELFGRELTDRAIRHRLQARGATRTCAEACCSITLTWQQPAHRRYCDQHHTPAARVRRHRHRQRKPRPTG